MRQATALDQEPNSPMKGMHPNDTRTKKWVKSPMSFLTSQIVKQLQNRFSGGESYCIQNCFKNGMALTWWVQKSSFYKTKTRRMHQCIRSKTSKSRFYLIANKLLTRRGTVLVPMMKRESHLTMMTAGKSRTGSDFMVAIIIFSSEPLGWIMPELRVVDRGFASDWSYWKKDIAISFQDWSTRCVLNIYQGNFIVLLVCFWPFSFRWGSFREKTRRWSTYVLVISRGSGDTRWPWP